MYVEGKQFHSFRKVAAEIELLGKVPLVSLHSISKGECVCAAGCCLLTALLV
jgi:aspartate/methionine/tyrosine aminotransferase